MALSFRKNQCFLSSSDLIIEIDHLEKISVFLSSSDLIIEIFDNLIFEKFNRLIFFRFWFRISACKHMQLLLHSGCSIPETTYVQKCEKVNSCFTIIVFWHIVSDSTCSLLCMLKNLNDFQVLIVFKLPELPPSCSKRIVNVFQLSRLMIKLPMESF